MSKLVSSVDLKKADNKTITFNFQFKNGLPVKPLLKVKREIWINENSLYGITVMLSEEDMKHIIDFNIKEISYHETNDSDIKTIWIHLEKCYLILSNINSKLLVKMLEKKLLFIFVDNKQNQLN